MARRAASGTSRPWRDTFSGTAKDFRAPWTLAVLALPLLLSTGCSLASLPYRSVRAVVDPDHARRADDERHAADEARRREARAYRAYLRCRSEGYPDC